MAIANQRDPQAEGIDGNFMGGYGTNDLMVLWACFCREIRRPVKAEPFSDTLMTDE